MKKDLRKIPASEKECIRKAARLKLRELRGNLSATARELGVNRQILYAWLAKPESLWNVKKCDDILRWNQKSELFNTLYHKKPSDYGLQGYYWTIQSIHRILLNVLKVNFSVYILKKILLESGFLNSSQFKNIFNDSYPETEGLPAAIYARNKNYRCFYMIIESLHHRFLVMYSQRGDFRMTNFIPEAVSSRDGLSVVSYKYKIDAFIQHLADTCKNKMMIIHNIKNYKPEKALIERNCLLIRRNT